MSGGMDESFVLLPTKDETDQVISRLTIIAYHVIGMYFTINHCIRVPLHVFSLE